MTITSIYGLRQGTFHHACNLHFHPTPEGFGRFSILTLTCIVPSNGGNTIRPVRCLKPHYTRNDVLNLSPQLVEARCHTHLFINPFGIRILPEVNCFIIFCISLN